MMTFALNIRRKYVMTANIFTLLSLNKNVITKLKFVVDTNPILTFKVNL